MLVAPQFSHHQRREVTTYSVASKERGSLHCSIQQAIDKAEPFSRIVVSGGTYFESITVTQPIELVGEEGDPPEITNRGVCLTVTADVECLFENIHFLSRSSSHGGGGSPMRGRFGSNQNAVRIVRGKPSLNKCTMTSLYVGGNSCPFVHKCTIMGNSFGSGLVVAEDADGEYTSNTICNHLPYCVLVRSKSAPVFHENAIFQEPKAIAAMLAAAPFESKLGGAVLISWDGADVDVERSIRPKFTSNRIGEVVIPCGESATSFVQMLPHTTVNSNRLVIGDRGVSEEVDVVLQSNKRHGMAGLQQHLNLQQLSAHKRKLDSGKKNISDRGGKSSSAAKHTGNKGGGGGDASSTQQLFDKLNSRRGIEGCHREVEERMCLLKDLLAERHVIRVDSGCTPLFEDNHITGGHVAVVISSHAGGTFTGNQISQSLLYGVQLHSESAPVFRNNTIHTCATGIFAYASLATLEQNTVKECMGAGLVYALHPTHRGYMSHNSYVGNDVGIIVIPGVKGSVALSTNNAKAAMIVRKAHHDAAMNPESKQPKVTKNNSLITTTSSRPPSATDLGLDAATPDKTDADTTTTTFADSTKEGAEEALIQGGVVCLNRSCGLLVMGPTLEVTFEDVDIGSNGRSGSVFTMGCLPTIRKCRFERGSVAMVVEQASYPIVEDCLFSTHSDASVIVRSHGRGVFTRCLFAAFGRIGIQVDDGGDPILYENTFGSLSGTCIDVTCGGIGTFTKNNMTDVARGVTVSILGDPLILRNTIQGASSEGIRVHDDGCGTFVDNTVKECTVGIACGDGALATIRSNTIDRSMTVGIHTTSGSHSLIEKNTITASGDVNIMLEGDDNCCRIIRNKCLGSHGFGIKSLDGATAMIRSNTTTGNKMGGMCCEKGGSSMFISNTSTGDIGPGIVLGKGSNSTFTSCIATLSSLCGLLVESGSESVVQRCQFTSNDKEGIKVLPESLSVVTNCVVSHNAGAGVLLVAAKTSQPGALVPLKRRIINESGGKSTSKLRKEVLGAQLSNLLVEANKGGGLVAEPNAGGSIRASVFKYHIVDVAAEAKKAKDALPPMRAAQRKLLAKMPFEPADPLADTMMSASISTNEGYATVQAEADPADRDSQLLSGHVLSRVEQMSFDNGKGVGVYICCPSTLKPSQQAVTSPQPPPSPPQNATVVENCFFTGNSVGVLLCGGEDGESGRVPVARRGTNRTGASATNPKLPKSQTTVRECRFSDQLESDVAMVRGAHATVDSCLLGPPVYNAAADASMRDTISYLHRSSLDDIPPPPPPTLLSAGWEESLFLKDLPTVVSLPASSQAAVPPPPQPQSSPFGICSTSSSLGVITCVIVSKAKVAGVVFGAESSTQLIDSTIVGCGVGVVCRNLAVPSITGNTVSDSVVANAVVHWLSSPQITKNTFESCRSHGVVLCNRRGLFTENDVQRNGGSGVVFRASAALPLGAPSSNGSPMGTSLAPPVTFTSTSVTNPHRKRSSAAQLIANTAACIHSNTIAQNGMFGVVLERDSSGELAKNTIKQNSKGGVSVGCNSAVLIHDGNRIEGNLGSGGVQVKMGGDPILTDCVISCNEPCGLYLEEGSKGCYESNKITSNLSEGIIICSNSSAQIHRNTISEHEKGAAVKICGPSPKLRITQGNIVSANENGIISSENSGASGFINGNVFKHNRGFSVIMHIGAALIVTENRFTGCGCCVALHERSGGQLVSNYFSGNHEVIRILGGNISTICKGNALLDNKRGFVVCARGGYTVEGNTFGPHEEAAVQVHGEGDCTITNNIFQGGGCGVRVEGESTPYIHSNTFFRCVMGISITCFGRGGATVERNAFTLCDTGIVSQNFNHLAQSILTGTAPRILGRRTGVSFIAHNYLSRCFTAGIHLRVPSSAAMGAVLDSATAYVATEAGLLQPPVDDNAILQQQTTWDVQLVGTTSTTIGGGGGMPPHPIISTEGASSPLSSPFHTILQRNVFSENWFIPVSSCGLLITSGGGVSAKILDNDFHRNAVGIRGEGPCTGEISNCVLHHNEIGCWFTGSSCVADVRSCVVYGNRSCGIYITDFATPTISDSLFREGAGTSSEASFSAAMVPCLPTGLFPSTDGSIVIGANGGGEVTGNLFRNCTVGVTLLNASRTHITLNYIHGGSIGVLVKGDNKMGAIKENYMLDCEVGVGVGEGGVVDTIEGNLLEGCDVGMLFDKSTHCGAVERNGVIRSGRTGILLRGGPSRLYFRQNVIEECVVNGVLQNYAAPLPLLSRSSSESSIWTRSFDPLAGRRRTNLTTNPFTIITTTQHNTSKGGRTSHNTSTEAVVVSATTSNLRASTSIGAPPRSAASPIGAVRVTTTGGSALNSAVPPLQLIKTSPLFHAENLCVFELNFIRHCDNNVSLQNGIIAFKANYIYGGNYGLLLKATHQQTLQGINATSAASAPSSSLLPSPHTHGHDEVMDDLHAHIVRNVVFENHKGGCLLGVKEPLTHLVAKGNQFYNRGDGAVVLATNSTPPISKENEVFNNCPFKQLLPHIYAPLKLATLRSGKSSTTIKSAISEVETGGSGGGVPTHKGGLTVDTSTTDVVDDVLDEVLSPGAPVKRKLHRGVDNSGAICAAVHCIHTLELPDTLKVVPDTVFVGPDGKTISEQQMQQAIQGSVLATPLPLDPYIDAPPRKVPAKATNNNNTSITGQPPPPSPLQPKPVDEGTDDEEDGDHEVAKGVRGALSSMQLVDECVSTPAPQPPLPPLRKSSLIRTTIDEATSPSSGVGSGVVSRTTTQPSGRAYTTTSEQFPTSLALLQPGVVLRRYIGCPLLTKSYTRGDVPTGYKYEPLRFVESRPSSVPSLPLHASPRGGPRRRSNFTGVMAVANLTSSSSPHLVAAASSTATTPQLAKSLVPKPPLKEAVMASSARPIPTRSQKAAKSSSSGGSTTPRPKRSTKSKSK